MLSLRFNKQSRQLQSVWSCFWQFLKVSKTPGIQLSMWCDRVKGHTPRTRPIGSLGEMLASAMCASFKNSLTLKRQEKSFTKTKRDIRICTCLAALSSRWASCLAPTSEMSNALSHFWLGEQMLQRNDTNTNDGALDFYHNDTLDSSV